MQKIGDGRKKAMDNNKRYTIKLYKFRVDENFREIGNPILTKLDCNTIGECMRVYRFLKDCNDMTKFGPYWIDEIIDNMEMEEKEN